MSEKRIKLAADTGGTFTDLVVHEEGSPVRFYKRSTTPSEPVTGVLNALEAAAEGMAIPLAELLARTDLFVFGTTRATNAIVTGSTAKTALLVTEGHPDILLFREGGGRRSLFNYSQEYPEPYIPPDMTFQVRERILSNGEIHTPLDEFGLTQQFEEMEQLGVEAVAVSLLWSPINDQHEVRAGELISEHLPNVPFTLSSRLNPSVREYRRTSSAAIDASLKPLMSRFFNELEQALRDKRFAGRLLIMTSAGGVLDAAEVADTPIHSIGSGPAGAPVAGRYFAALDSPASTAIVTDAGGTTFDVSLMRNNVIPTTRETMVGDQIAGYLTGFPSVDVRSIGAGGGSIAWVDSGGLLHVGPKSAGADPGPACYGQGGEAPTVTDACLVLGYIDPDYFLGGKMRVSEDLAKKAVKEHVADLLDLDLHQAAAAILELAIENMVTAIEEITLNQGIDPKESMIIGGGGGAGLYCDGIARRLDCWPVLVPSASAALSATGAMLSDLQAAYLTTELLMTGNFDYQKANAVLSALHSRCKHFATTAGADSLDYEINYYVEARYPHQVWEIEVPLAIDEFKNADNIEKLKADFHDHHDQLFAVRDTDSEVEILSWGARVTCKLQEEGSLQSPSAPGVSGQAKSRQAYFRDEGLVETQVMQVEDIDYDKPYKGPLLVESPVTTLVVNPGSVLTRKTSGSIMITN